MRNPYSLGESLLPHGELDGYQAKLIVLHGIGVKSLSGDPLIGDRQAEFVADAHGSSRRSARDSPGRRF